MNWPDLPVIQDIRIMLKEGANLGVSIYGWDFRGLGGRLNEAINDAGKCDCGRPLGKPMCSVCDNDE